MVEVEVVVHKPTRRAETLVQIPVVAVVVDHIIIQTIRVEKAVLELLF